MSERRKDLPTDRGQTFTDQISALPKKGGIGSINIKRTCMKRPMDVCGAIKL